MASTSAELEAKLLKRRQKCEGAISPPTQKGSRVWSDEMAKTVSQQRRARLNAQGGDANGNPQDVDTAPRSVSSTSSSSRPKGKDVESAAVAARFGQKYLILLGCIPALLLCMFLSQRPFERPGAELASHMAGDSPEDSPEEDWPELSEKPLVPMKDPLPELEEELPFDLQQFSATVQESHLQPHHSSVAADARAPRDLTSEWSHFLSENGAIRQVYRLGRLTVSEASSRPVAVTVNITLANTGQGVWPARTALQIAHGSDMGVNTLLLGRVIEPGMEQQVSLHLKVPRTKQADSPTCIWALSLDGHVFGVLLLLEIDWIESHGSGLLEQASDILQSARAHVHHVRLQLHHEALNQDATQAGDVTEEWSADLRGTSMTEAYRLGSLWVAPSQAGDVGHLEVFVSLENPGQDPWPNETQIQLVSGRSFGVESLEVDPVNPGSQVEIVMPLDIPLDPAADVRNVVEESVWALAVAGHTFGPLLVLELRYTHTTKVI